MCLSPRMNGGPANGHHKALPPAVGCISLPRSGCCPLWAAASRLEDALSEVGLPHPLSAHSDGFLRVEVEVDGITDPVHWLGHQQRCPRMYFRDQRKEVCVAGVGAADSIRVAGAPNEAMWRHASRALQGASPRMRYYGGARFDQEQKPAAEWEDFGGCTLLLPLLEVQRCGDKSLLACHLRWRPDASEGGARSFAEAASRARAALGSMCASAEVQPEASLSLPSIASQARTAHRYILAGAIFHLLHLLVKCLPGAFNLTRLPVLPADPPLHWAQELTQAEA